MEDLTFKAGNLLGRESPPGKAQWVAMGVPVAFFHIQAHLRASCHSASCMAIHDDTHRCSPWQF